MSINKSNLINTEITNVKMELFTELISEILVNARRRLFTEWYADYNN